MDANEYQERAMATAIYPASGNPLGLCYASLGLTNEAGEVAGKVKKYLRDDSGWLDLRDQVRAELGDVMWYVAATCHELNITLGEVMEENLRKLADRQARGVLGGSGDTR